MVVSADLAALLAMRGNHPNLLRILGVHHNAGAAQLMVEHVPGRTPVSYTHLTLPTSDLV